MTKDINEMRATLIDILKAHEGTLKVTADNESKFEVAGTIPAMQGKKKVEGFYFASVIPKPKDVRLYFFPIYTHKEAMGTLSDKLQKALKGKSCFHIKMIDEDIKNDIEQMVAKAIEIYQKEGLI